MLELLVARGRRRTTVNITTIGKGNIGGELGRRWAAAGHLVVALGRDGGDVSGALFVKMGPVFYRFAPPGEL
ncbi:MAG: hypothetical protein ABI838_07995 [Chloroflexota bacterium]